MRIDIFIILLIGAVLLYRWYQKAPKEKVEDAEPSSSEPSSTEMVLDPNCSTYVPETEAIKATIVGTDYYFCSEKCAEIYRKKKSAV
jgi:YHS domain-containing protein